MSRHVLIVDDDLAILGSLSADLGARGFRVSTARTGDEAVSTAELDPPDVVLLDLRLGRESGLDVLDRLQALKGSPPPVVMISGEGTIADAVDAVHRGALDFIEKPLSGEQVTHRVGRLLENLRLRADNDTLRSAAGISTGIIGESAAIREVLETVALVASAPAPVLVTGESGTGKELVARAIHDASGRAREPFVAVNCSAIPKDLVESELFGHQKGAFTGATHTRRGVFESAGGGTLLLDEIGDMPLAAQPKLLRTLESGEVQRVGAERTIPVDVRVIAATNRDLRKAYVAGEFREDLFHRLNVVEIHLPPLRERPEDVPVLADHFLRFYAERYAREPIQLTDDAVAALVRQPFSGNVRELRNLMERLTILCPTGAVDAARLRAIGGTPSGSTPEWQPPPLVDGEHALRNTLRLVERRLVVETLDTLDGNMAQTARRLGLERSHLYRKLRELDIERE